MLWILGAALVGCDVKEVGSAGPAQGERDTEVPRKAAAASTEKPSEATIGKSRVKFDGVSEKKCEAIVDRIDEAVRTSDTSLLDDAFDVATMAILSSEIEGSKMPDEEVVRRKLESQGLNRGTALHRIVESVAPIVSQGGAYDRLRMRKVGDRTVATYRLLNLQGGMNYHDFAFARISDGSVRIVDIYTYSVGEWLSVTQTRLAGAAFGPPGERMTKSEIAARDREYEKWLAAMPLVQAGEAEAFDRAVAELSPEMQRQKFVLVMQIQAAGPDEERRYRHTDRLLELFPDDPATSYACIDRYRAAGRHDEALTALANLGAQVGGDPFLTSLRAETLVAMNRLAEARAAGVAAHEAEPSLEAPCFTLAYVAVVSGEFDEAADWLGKVADLRGVSRRDVIDFDAEGIDPAWYKLRDSDAWRSANESRVR